MNFAFNNEIDTKNSMISKLQRNQKQIYVKQIEYNMLYIYVL